MIPRDREALGAFYASGYPENRRKIADPYVYRITMVPRNQHIRFSVCPDCVFVYYESYDRNAVLVADRLDISLISQRMKERRSENWNVEEASLFYLHVWLL